MEGNRSLWDDSQEPEEQNVFQQVLEAYMTIRTQKFEARRGSTIGKALLSCKYKGPSLILRTHGRKAWHAGICL